MAGKSRQVTIQFLGDARSFVNATGKATHASDTFGSKLRNVGKAAIVGFGIAAVAAGKVMYEFADAAVQDEKAASLLANTLRNATGATKAQIAANEDWITTQGKLYGVMDDDLRPALGKLATATGSITKAQKLASLAMDVSAGTGKDLSSISLALAKAQNGSLAGLGRLGVATKNAAGETKTLAEITDDLSKKYKGSAATAAETAAGKFQRLKVELSETGEAIGYKLLPYANDLGDWLLKTGVPALEKGARAAKHELTPALKDLSGFIKDNKDEFADLGHEVVATVIPALRTVGGVAGDAVRFFSGLPGPIKSVGAEAAIAAIAIPKMSAAMNGLTSSIGLGTTKLAGWRKGLLLAAGVGGVGAMTEGARTGNKAVSLFGDALTGAFVGGTLGSAIPGIGTAIGAVGGAAVGTGIGLFRMHKGADAAGDSSKDATPKIEGLAASLNQVTGAATRATKAMILQKLQEDGVASSAGQLGIATSDLIKSVLGNQKAIDRVNTAWEKNGNLLDGITNQKISSWLGTLRQDLSKSEQSVKDANAALDGTDRAARRAGQGLASVGKDRPSTDKWTALYSGDLNKATGSTDNFSNSTRRLLGAVTKGAGTGVKQVNSLATAVDRLRDKTITITVKTNQIGGVTSSAGGHSAPDPSDKVANLDDYRSLLGGLDARTAELAGNNLIEAITRGLKKGERTLHNVMAGLQDYIQKKTDALKDLLDQRASFVDSFRDAFSESIFSAQFTDAEGGAVPPTIQKMMDFAKQQQANAHQLSDNIRSLLTKGLSKDLLSQLVSQGQSGYEQIAALAGGSQADIDAFNQINSDIKTTLEGLGQDIWGALNPNENGQIKLLTDQIAAANRQEALLQKIADNAGKDGEIKIKGTDLIILIRHIEQSSGRQLLVTPA